MVAVYWDKLRDKKRAALVFIDSTQYAPRDKPIAWLH